MTSCFAWTISCLVSTHLCARLRTWRRFTRALSTAPDNKMSVKFSVRTSQIKKKSDKLCCFQWNAISCMTTTALSYASSTDTWLTQQEISTSCLSCSGIWIPSTDSSRKALFLDNNSRESPTQKKVRRKTSWKRFRRTWTACQSFEAATQRLSLRSITSWSRWRSQLVRRRKRTVLISSVYSRKMKAVPIKLTWMQDWTA